MQEDGFFYLNNFSISSFLLILRYSAISDKILFNVPTFRGL